MCIENVDYWALREHQKGDNRYVLYASLESYILQPYSNLDKYKPAKLPPGDYYLSIHTYGVKYFPALHVLFAVVLSFAGSREHALAAQIRTTTTAATPETTTPYSNTTTSPPQSVTEATATASPVDVLGGTTDAQGEEEEASIPWEELVLLLGEMTVKSTTSSYSEDWPNIPDVWGNLQDNLNDKMDKIYSLWNNTDFQL